MNFLKLASQATAAAAVAMATTSVHAAIVYGDFSGDTVDYINVMEDNQQLFGAPIISGDSLVFAPVDFDAESVDGGAELTDGTLSMFVMAQDGFALTDLVIEEAGFFTLAGIGTDITRVFAGLAASVNIIEVDGTPFVGSPSILNFSETLADFNLADDGVNFLTAWSGIFSVDIADAAASQLGITGDITKVSLTINNQLLAVSEDGSVSFIDKKALDAIVVTVPEPAAVALFASGLAVMTGVRRRTA
jgi:hypothetical protein